MHAGGLHYAVVEEMGRQLMVVLFSFFSLDETRSARGEARRRGRMFSSIYAFFALFFLRVGQDRDGSTRSVHWSSRIGPSSVHAPARTRTVVV